PASKRFPIVALPGWPEEEGGPACRAARTESGGDPSARAARRREWRDSTAASPALARADLPVSAPAGEAARGAGALCPVPGRLVEKKAAPTLSQPCPAPEQGGGRAEQRTLPEALFREAETFAVCPAILPP